MGELAEPAIATSFALIPHDLPGCTAQPASRLACRAAIAYLWPPIKSVGRLFLT